MRKKSLKKVVLALGLGIGLSSTLPAAAGSYCYELYKKCDFGGQTWACQQYMRECGELP